MNFPRQMQPISISFTGEWIDVDYYMHMIKRMIESRGYDSVEIIADQMKIYPAANND